MTLRHLRHVDGGTGYTVLRKQIGSKDPHLVLGASLLKIRLHTKNPLPMFSGTAFNLMGLSVVYQL